MSTQTQRFTFHGFSLVRQNDTSTHEVEVGSVSVGDEVFIVHMIRRKELSFEGNFLVSKVFSKTEEELLWEFPKDFFDRLGFLAKAGEEPVIALIGKGRAGKVMDVIPLSSLASFKQLELNRKVKLKQLAARHLERECIFTTFEDLVVKRQNRRQREKERAAQDEAYRQRLHTRAELRARVEGRGRIEVRTSDGRRRLGYPITETEWPSLPGDTHVVLVESYNDETNAVGTPIEAFVVTKETGKNPKKSHQTSVSWGQQADNSKSIMQDVPQPVDTIVVEVNEGNAYEVSVYATMDDIRRVRETGLNSGVYAAALDRKVDEHYEVFSVRTKDIKTIGKFAPITG